MTAAFLYLTSKIIFSGIRPKEQEEYYQLKKISLIIIKYDIWLKSAILKSKFLPCLGGVEKSLSYRHQPSSCLQTAADAQPA